MKTEYARSVRYEGRAGEKYFAWQSRSAGVTSIIEARKFQKHLEPEDTVLDFGCGGGFILSTLRCGTRLGVEVNPAAQKIALANGIRCFDTLEAIPDGTVDTAISNHALEHVPFPIHALQGIRAKLKPGGKLVLVLPVDDWRTQRRYNRSDIHHHLHTWTPQLLGNTLFEAGFTEEVDLRMRTHAWFPGTSRFFSRMPERLFDLLCGLFSILNRQRELVAVTVKPTSDGLLGCE